MPYRLPADRLILSELIQIMLFLACLFPIAQARCGAPAAPHIQRFPKRFSEAFSEVLSKKVSL